MSQLKCQKRVPRAVTRCKKLGDWSVSRSVGALGNIVQKSKWAAKEKTSVNSKSSEMPSKDKLSTGGRTMYHEYCPETTKPKLVRVRQNSSIEYKLCKSVTCKLYAD